MEPKFIFTKESEYKDYLMKSKIDNKIRIFFRDILRSMPKKLKQEINNSPTNLKDTNKFINRIIGAKEFSFITENSSKELKDYLSNFKVFVERDTPEIIKWKRKIKNYQIRK
jgi:hypothetical protein